MGFSTKECAWSKTSVKVLGRTLVGITGFDLNKKIDAEYLYGGGDEPIDIQTGNKSYPGSLELMKFEVDLLNEAAQSAGFEDILEVPHEAIVITCVFKKTLTSPIKTLTSLATKFTELPYKLNQNDKSMKMNLPLMSMKTTVL